MRGLCKLWDVPPRGLAWPIHNREHKLLHAAMLLHPWRLLLLLLLLLLRLLLLLLL